MFGTKPYHHCMPSRAIGASPAVARFLKDTRESLGLTLRGVASLSSKTGHPIPHSTLARIERGKLDPGVQRLQQLLRLYNLPTQAAGDLLDLEALAGPVPFERDPVKIRDLAIAAWREGRVGDALAHFFAFRDRVN
jgi:transcriptional regulator with XRE-family HTH domain